MPPRIYPTVAETIEAHRLLMEEFGGLHGIRDKGLLESAVLDRKSTRLNSSHGYISYAVFCLKTESQDCAHHGSLDPRDLLAFAISVQDSLLWTDPHLVVCQPVDLRMQPTQANRT